MQAGVLSATFKTEPYWTDGLQPFVAPAAPSGGSIDVAVIGGGLAGLSAALTLARHGCRVTVFEAGRIGDGAAARSAGALGHVPKAGLAELTDLYGRSTALAVYREARQARNYVEALIREHHIECGLRIGARFIAAHSPRAFARQRDNLESLRTTWGEVELVPRDEQRREIGSDAFYGGLKLPNSATLQPALFQRGLAQSAVNAGATLLQGSRVLEVRREAGVFRIVTRDGSHRAEHVILATNADTGTGPARFRALARRLIAIPAYGLSTEEVGDELMRRVLPIGGPVSDTYKIVHYIAPNETGRRFIISGRAGRADGGLAHKAERLFGYFAERFPDLAGVKVSHCWTGRFAITGDWVPHIGVEDGIHYVLGCCGTGIPMATYLGHRVAEKILRHEESESAFERPLPALRFHGARTLLLPLAVRAYSIRDRLFR
jgi:glycine/D-amino acid oxidase-like deaminating enzyme